MTVCDCQCHQMPSERSNCGDCGNTGIKYPDTTTLDQKLIINPVSKRPMYEKGTLALPINPVLLGD